MKTLHSLKEKPKAKYGAGGDPLAELGTISHYCLVKLASEASVHARTTLGEKSYVIFASSGRYARPCREDLLVAAPKDFLDLWDDLTGCMDPKEHLVHLGPDEINRVLYTASFAFSACYDLWKPKSRKTPGTYFEILIGSIMGKLLPDHVRSKFIAIPDETERVPTDIVFRAANDSGGLVVACKTSTRERIVQPFAHQRILDAVFGPDEYRTILVCVSETQLVGDSEVKDTCVPGTIRLFQSYLAKLAGMYYLDPPERYVQPDVTEVVPVSSVAQLLTKGLPDLI